MSFEQELEDKILIQEKKFQELIIQRNPSIGN